MDEHETGEESEPSIFTPPSRMEARLNRALERVASVLGSVVAMLLIVLVAVALVAVVRDAWPPIVHELNLSEGVLRGLDSAFLAVILLELVHTTLSRGPISRQVQEFLVIGITSAVRTGLEVTAGAHDGEPHAVVIDLVINSVAVLILVGALLLVRRHLATPRASTDADSAPR